ncbi:hypothetical protein AMK59_1600 [Oryctes borbonicus]|uniref:Serine-threonine/tyrosine-protein kinase catalytic domain-containing protein n=1 Tax=Oryctes borbonicus TaxID=1629725 RepID=A0A0T6B9N1_9SCAR|nr:hypothetical protein AMK59_1600 [Oryctes borbonicus]
MLNCWEAEPLTRPTFQSLSDRIGSMLGEPVTKFYIDLNDPYLVMNKERIQGGQNDYLQMVSPPDFETLSSPNRPRPTLNTTRYDYIPKPSRPLFGSSKP